MTPQTRLYLAHDADNRSRIQFVRDRNLHVTELPEPESESWRPLAFGSAGIATGAFIAMAVWMVARMMGGA